MINLDVFYFKNKYPLLFKENNEHIFHEANMFLNNIEDKKTLQIYSRVIFRFIFWINVYELQITPDILKDYKMFLENPQPYELFVGCKMPFNHPLWKPFNSKLSSSSVKFNLIILQNFIKNQFPNTQIIEIKTCVLESNNISLNQIISCLNKIDCLLEGEKKSKLKQARFRWIILLTFFVGVKVEELANLTTSQLKRDKDGVNFINLENNGNFIKLLLPKQFIIEFKKYKKSFKNSFYKDINAPLIVSLINEKGLKTNTIQQEILKLKNKIIDKYPEDLEIQSFIKNFSLNKIRQAAIVNNLNSNNLHKGDLMQLYDMNLQTYNKYKTISLQSISVGEF